MTDDEIAAAGRLDEYAKSKASWFGEKFSSHQEMVVNAVRGLVCEWALQQYLFFANKFDTGNPTALRKLLDEFWSSIENKDERLEANIVEERLNDAEIQVDDWDDPSASDAAASLSIIDACIGSSGNCVKALTFGIEMLLGYAAKKMIDECAAADGVLAELASSIESGDVLIPAEKSLLAVLKNAEIFTNNPDQFVSWARSTVAQQA